MRKKAFVVLSLLLLTHFAAHRGVSTKFGRPVACTCLYCLSAVNGNLGGATPCYVGSALNSCGEYLNSVCAF